MNYTEIIPTRYGNIVGLKCDPYITQSLQLYGESTAQEIAMCLEFIKPGDVVLDVGANIGTFTIPFAQRVGPAGAVIAFEPQRLPFLCLCANIVMNSLGQWASPNKFAIGHQSNTTVDVPLINPNAPNNNIGGVRLGQHCKVTEQVPIEAIDNIGIQKVDFIKIDVEGMEIDVLRGAVQLLFRDKPIIFFECLPDEVYRSSLIDFFKIHDYETRLFITNLFSPDNIRRNPVNIFGDQCDYNVLAIPKEKAKPDWFANGLPFE